MPQRSLGTIITGFKHEVSYLMEACKSSHDIILFVLVLASF